MTGVAILARTSLRYWLILAPLEGMLEDVLIEALQSEARAARFA
jgi:hypothetical protein